MKKYPDSINDRLAFEARVVWSDRLKCYVYDHDLTRGINESKIVVLVHSIILKTFTTVESCFVRSEQIFEITAYWNRAEVNDDSITSSYKNHTAKGSTFSDALYALCWEMEGVI